MAGYLKLIPTELSGNTYIDVSVYVLRTSGTAIIGGERPLVHVHRRQNHLGAFPFFSVIYYLTL